jgi:glycosyltransferase involved in cell wall biosynthesis
MKILHFVQSSDPKVGGSLTVARELVKAQRDLGLDAWLVTLYDLPSAGNEVRHLPFEIACAIPRDLRWTRGVVGLRRLVQSHQPDIIHHHDGILWPRLACLGLGIPRVSHGHLGPPAQKYFTSAWLTHLGILLTTQHFIAISQWVAESWAECGMAGNKITLIPNGVDPHRFYRREENERQKIRSQYGIGEGEVMLVWAGRLDKETKGLNRLVNLARHLDSRVKLVVMGDGPDNDWLKESMACLKMANPPLFTGMVGDSSTLFGVADVFMFTSQEESFGLVLLEAACSGLPIYAFSCFGGGRELLDKLRVYRADETDYPGLANAILHQKNGPLKETQRLIHDHYTWQAVAYACARVYTAMVSQGGMSRTVASALPTS